MADKRTDDVAHLIDPIHARFLQLLLDGNMEVSRRLRDELAAIQSLYERHLPVWWEDLVTLTLETPSGEEVRYGQLITPPFVVGSQNPLNDVEGAIGFREAVKGVAANYDLPDDVWPHLHRYLRDGHIWEDSRYDPSTSLNVTLVAVVQPHDEPLALDLVEEGGTPCLLLKAPLEQAWFESFTVNPLGEWSLTDEKVESLSTELKRRLTPFWRRRPRRRDPARAMYCAYLRDVVGTGHVEIWKEALAGAPGQWGGASGTAEITEATKRRKVQEYVRAGRRLLNEGNMSE